MSVYGMDQLDVFDRLQIVVVIVTVTLENGNPWISYHSTTLSDTQTITSYVKKSQHVQ